MIIDRRNRLEIDSIEYIEYLYHWLNLGIIVDVSMMMNFDELIVIDDWKKNIENVNFSGVNDVIKFINDFVLDFLSFDWFDSHSLFYINQKHKKQMDYL